MTISGPVTLDGRVDTISLRLLRGLCRPARASPEVPAAQAFGSYTRRRFVAPVELCPGAIFASGPLQSVPASALSLSCITVLQATAAGSNRETIELMLALSRVSKSVQVNLLSTFSAY